MNESDMIYEELNRRWRSTCKLLLGEEIGALKDYEGWLSSQGQRTTFRKSPDGKTVAFFLPYYSEGSRISSYGDVDFNRRFEPLTINEVKDIDSIIQAVRERVSYAGNVVLGTSRHVERSTDIVDSFYVSDSAQVWNSKYIAHSFALEHGDSLFGCTYNGNFKFSIATHSGDYLVRCLMTDNTYESSDCHYCFGLSGAKDCLFSFNLQSASRRIGNLELPLEKFGPLKVKLLSEIAEALRKEKRLPSIFELAGMHAPDRSALERVKKAPPPEARSFGDETREIEKEFSLTAKVLLGRELGPMGRYEKWLRRFSALPTKKVRSAFDGEEIELPDYCSNFEFPEGRVVKREHALALSRISSISASEADEFGLSSAPKLISKIAYFCQEYFAGKNLNLLGTQITINAVNAVGSTIVIDSRNCGHDYYMENSKSVFGSNSVRKSSYSLKCYLSTLLTRCFEVDSSKNCSDSYFLHNCENVHDSMFCFNAKNKRNAIGNAELEKGKYASIKEKVKSELAEELEKTGGIRLSVFNLAE